MTGASRWLWLMGLGLTTASASAQTLAGDPQWMAQKCSLYTQAWQALTSGQGGDGLGAEFLARHDAFLASGCTARADVCPTNAAERGVADAVSMMAVAEGMAGSFLPFACR